MNFFKIVITTCLVSIASMSIADGLPSSPYISVSGVAKIQVKPDTVKLSFQATATENSAVNAKQVVDQQVQLLLSKLQANGFKEHLLIREDIRLHPEYDFIKKKQTQVGIKAVRNLSYQLDDTMKVNLLLELLVEADIANIGNVHYSLQQPIEWETKARELAVQNSIDKAEGLAKSYQATLGKVYSIRYQSNYNPPVMMRTLESKTTPDLYQNKKITITERVDTVFLLEH